MDKKSTPSSRSEPKKRKKITASYLENAGAYYLERFAASEGQFRRVMQRKILLSCRDHPDQSAEACGEMLETVVTKFKTLGYLNDRLYAESQMRILRMKGTSKTHLFGTLRRKGVPEPLLAELLDGFAADETPDTQEEDYDFVQAVRRAKKKRLGAFRTKEMSGDADSQQKDTQRALASLARAGFSYDIARRVIDLPLDEAEEILAGG